MNDVQVRPGVVIAVASLTARMHLAETLDAEGFAVTPCGTVGFAREALAAGVYRAVVLEPVLPDGDGLQLVRELRREPAAQHLWVALLCPETEAAALADLPRGADLHADGARDGKQIADALRAALAAQPPPQPLPPPEHATILVIDDSITYREQLRETLELHGYSVLTATTGEEGLRIAAAQRPTAVVVDNMLPGIDGAAVVRRLRTAAGLNQTPCLLLTASDKAQDELHGLDSGADAYVRKGDNTEVILARLAALLRRVATQQSQAPAGPSRVLAVDDSKSYLGALTDQLAEEGYELAVASSGEAALAKLAELPVDCILLDRMMPGIGGIETCRRIRASAEWRHIPIVMLTASEEREAVIEGLNAGADDYIVKSDDFQVLKGRIRAQLRRKHFEDENRRIRERLHEKEIEAARELTSNRAKSAFLANMSHELRTPMNAIVGMTELLLHDTSPSAEQQEYLATILTSSEALLRLLNDVLDLSKIEAGKLEVVGSPFHLRYTMGDVMTTFAVQAAHKQIELACEIPPDVPDALVGDPGRLRQILVNLIGNGLKFTERGEIVVSVKLEHRDSESVVLHFGVRDTGMGIPREKHEAIFRPFEQADVSTTRRFGGTGLGLTISGKLTEMMGGRIWVESEPGQGSEFHFTARFGRPADQPATMPPAEATVLQGLRALVVDDNAAGRAVVEHLLQTWGLEVTAVGSGVAALETFDAAVAQRRPYDVVVLDAYMPEMDGFQVAQHMLGVKLPSPTVVVMLTSAGQRGDGARCREIGIAAYLRKPVKQADLLAALRTALGGQVRGARPELITRHSLHESVLPRRILLAEDHPVNQRLAVRLLEKLGHKVTLAVDGREAVQKAARQGFDIVLMDMQMPVLDGLEATREIRAQEQRTGRRVPVIALTANVLESDRKLCIDAGMDDFLPKPLRREALLETLLKWSQGRLPVLTVLPPEVHPGTAVRAFHAEEALGRMDGDRELLIEIANVLLEDAPQQLELLRGAQARADFDRVAAIAHALRGAVAGVGGVGLTGELQELENAGRARDATQIAVLFETVESGWRTFEREITEWMGRSEDPRS